MSCSRDLQPFNYLPDFGANRSTFRLVPATCSNSHVCRLPSSCLLGATISGASVHRDTVTIDHPAD